MVSSAATLAQGINNLSAAYSSQRQASQNDLGSAVNTLNATLTTIGQLSNQIVALKRATRAPPSWKTSGIPPCRRCRNCSRSRPPSNPTAT